MKLDPKLLAQLSVIVETGSFQSAADQLNLTQPGLSRNMRTLEERLGLPVFKRDGRRSVPNALGLKLARNGLAIRLAQEQAAVAADQSSKGTIGELRIGAPPIVAGRFLTDALASFIQRNPNCSIELRTGLVHELKAMLERGQIDIVLGPQSLANPDGGLEFSHLVDDRVGILCRAGHSLTQRHKITPKDLEQQVWVAHSRDSLLRQQTEAAMVASGLQSVQIGFETDSIRSVLEIVAQSDMISTMPIVTTTPYLESGLTFLPFDHPQFSRPLGFIHRRDTPQTPLQKNFLTELIRGRE